MNQSECENGILRVINMKYFWTEDERKIHRTTCCFEFQKGRFDGKTFWKNDSLCLHADIFDKNELFDIFSKSLNGFNYYGPNEVTADEWRILLNMSKKLGGVSAEIISELEPWVEENFKTYTVFSILGI